LNPRDESLGKKVDTPEVAPEQVRYAEWLRWSGWFGLALLVAAFVVYVTGVLLPHVPVGELPRVWKLSSGELAAHAGGHANWEWISLLHRGDMLNLLGIAVLSGCSALPLLAVTGTYLRRGDRLFAALCLLQVAVLVLAASGLVAVGH
jgi:hypothetical protein